MTTRGSLCRRIGLLVLCLLQGLLAYPSAAWAASLNGMSDTLSNTYTNTASSHTVAFNTATTSLLQKIDFQFSTTSGGITKPAHLNLGSATLGTVTNLGDSSWSLSTGSASSGLLSISRVTPILVASSSAASVVLQNITNSSLEDCQNTGLLDDVCYVNVTTYSDSGSTVVDTGTTTYTVYEDATLKFTVGPVAAGVTNNGITTSVASTPLSLDFGVLAPNSVKYAAQQITVATNAPHGYTVYASLSAPIAGTYASALISPFGATNATWTTPQSWTTPTGTTPNSNTGWFGANTTDTRVSGWSGNTSQKFGPISTTPVPVAYSSGTDPNGTTVTVTYALGVNSIQPSDSYSGKIIYNVYATY